MTPADNDRMKTPNESGAPFLSLMKKMLTSSILCSSGGFVMYHHGKEFGLSFLEGSWLTLLSTAVLILSFIRVELVEMIQSLSVSIRSTGEIIYFATKNTSDGLDGISVWLREIFRKIFF